MNISDAESVALDNILLVIRKLITTFDNYSVEMDIKKNSEMSVDHDFFRLRH